MSNVYVNKQKIDLLANAISAKSGEPVTMTLDEMVTAVDGIEAGGGVTPTGNIDITQAGVTDVTNYATATVPEANPLVDTTSGFYTESNERKFQVTPNVNVGISYGHDAGYLDVGSYEGWSLVFSAIPTGTTVTPTESAQTIGGANTMLEGAVTVSAIPSTYVGSGVTRRSSTDLTASGATVTVPSGYYASQATKEVPYAEFGDPAIILTAGEVQREELPVQSSLVVETGGYITAGTFEMDSKSFVLPHGTEGSPTATKGTVSNHSVTITPSVTNAEGYITGGTKTGTAVTVTASELVSGSQTITSNGTTNVTNLASVTVAVPFVTYYTGTSAPSASTGSNGDIYLKVVE